MSIALHLQNLRHALLASNQPPHAQKIENADPQTIPHAVVRPPVTARTVDHVDIADPKALARDQRRQKPMQAVEIRQRQKYLAPESLEAAAGVARAVAQHGAAYGIGNSGLKLLEAGIFASEPLARD